MSGIESRSGADERGGAVRTLFVAMFREEWRLHAELFGGGRFAAFPLFVLAVSAGGLALLDAVGTAQATIVGGLHLLVAFFGLQVGTIGLVGRDAMRNVLGDVTLLVFSSRTLPLSWRRLLATFVLKDLAYYGLLFLAPIALAYLPVALASGTALPVVGLLWLTLAGAFTLGVGLSLTLVGMASRHRLLPLAVVAAVTVAVVAGRFDPVAATPYGAYVDRTLRGVGLGFGPTVALAVGGVALFQPVERSRGRRRLAWARRLASLVPDKGGIARRSLLSVARSSGSVWKVVFSMGVLFVVAGVLLSELSTATDLDPDVGIAFGTLLGLGGFTTYAWLTQFEEPSEYLRYPVSIRQVFASKSRAYLALVVPTGVLYLGVAAIWFPARELAAGLVIFPLVAVYVYGLTAYVAGLSPTELLFDTPLFAVYGIGLTLVSLPLLVAALARAAAPTVTLAAAVGIAILAAVVGRLLQWRAGPRWDQRLRQ